MNAQIVHHAQFDPSTVKFAQAPVKTNRGSKIVYVNFDNGQRIRLQTPVMSAPFGISTYDEAASGTRSYSLDGSFKGYEDNAVLKSFLDKCRALDDHLAAQAAKNSKEWFGKSISLDAVKELTRKLIKDPMDPKYAPTIRFKVPTDSQGAPTTEFYDETGSPTDINYVVKGSSFRAILECSSVWFVGRQVGITLRVLQVAVTSRPAMAAQDKLSSFAFVDGDGDTVLDVVDKEDEDGM